jgi:hypothetical protein
MAEEQSIILKGMEDWHDWILTIKVIADSYQIWEFMDPDVGPEDLPVLTRPPKPTGNPIDAADLEFLKYDLKIWSDKNTALQLMPKEILKRIDKRCVYFIRDHSSTHTILRDLSAKLKPNDNLYKNLLLKKWKQLQKFPSR